MIEIFWPLCASEGPLAMCRSSGRLLSFKAYYECLSIRGHGSSWRFQLIKFGEINFFCTFQVPFRRAAAHTLLELSNVCASSSLSQGMPRGCASLDPSLQKGQKWLPGCYLQNASDATWCVGEQAPTSTFQGEVENIQPISSSHRSICTCLSESSGG